MSSLYHKFPCISHINDLAWAIKDVNEIYTWDKDEYLVIDYVVQTPNTFPEITSVHDWGKHSMRRECRGLIFNANGALISRPFEKFFNVGEKDWTQPNLLRSEELSYVCNKEDGSMVRPVKLPMRDDWQFMTRKGITDVSLEADAAFMSLPSKTKKTYNALVAWCIENNKTPVFEYVGPSNKIVLSYEKSDLILLAIRDNYTGKYMGIREIEALFNYHDWHVVSSVYVWKNSGNDSFLSRHMDIKDLTDIEGRVMVFISDEGETRVKLKTEWYVNLHIAKSQLEQPRNLVQMTMEGTLDDLYPELDATTKENVEAADVHFWLCLHDTVTEVKDMMSEIDKRGMSRKDVALSAFFDDNVLFRGIVFSCWGDSSSLNILDKVETYVKKNYLTNRSFEKVISLLSLDRDILNIRK